MTKSNARRAALAAVVLFGVAAIAGRSEAQYQPQPYQPQQYQPRPYQPQQYPPQQYQPQPYGRPAWGQPQPYQQPPPGYGQAPAGRASRQPIRNFFVGAGLGFGVTFAGGQAFFRLEEHFGYHVLNVDEHPGLFVSFSAVQGIANQVILGFAGRLGFDAVAWQDSSVRLQVTPSVGLGVGLFINNSGWGDSVFPGVYIEPALEVQLVVVDGFMTIWYRPLGFDIFARDGGTAAYTMMLGVNLNL